MGNEKLKDFFSVLSTNIAENGLEFVSTMEGKKNIFHITNHHIQAAVHSVDEMMWVCRQETPFLWGSVAPGGEPLSVGPSLQLSSFQQRCARLIRTG